MNTASRLDISNWKGFNWQIMSDDFIEPESESANRGRAYAGRQDGGQAHWFTTTHWSVVLPAGQANSPQAAEALENLCRTYWYPLYAYARRKGHSPEDAQDVTQGLFESLLRKDAFAKADQSKGRFRSFLLGSLEYFLKDEWKRASAQKRGGGQRVISFDEMDAETRYKCEPADPADHTKAYDRNWMGEVLRCVFRRLKAGFEAEGKPQRFEHLKPFLLDADGDYKQAAHKLGMTENAVRVAAHRLRERFRATLKEEVSNTVATPAEVDDEIAYMLALLSE